ncbi:electron transfer flavoprotein subunit beta/FixA family protein [Chloroflexota bacterium]
MNVTVLAKQIPDVEGHLEIDRASRVVSSQNIIVNPLDMSALEEAVRIREQLQNSSATVISLGTVKAVKALRDCLSGGADEAVHVHDPAFDRRDSHATGRILAKAIALQPYDIILCGQRSADTQAGVTGALVAEQLGIPLVTDVVKIELKPDASDLVLTRKLEAGKREVLEVSAPIVISVGSGINEPRYPSLRAIKDAKKKLIKTYDLKALGYTDEGTDIYGSMTRVVEISSARPALQRLFIPDSTFPAATRVYLLMGGGISEKKTKMIAGSPEEIASQFVDLFTERRII